MSGKLRVMYGASAPASSLFLDPRGKSDFDAGLLILGALGRMHPGLTWDDLARIKMNGMAGWWTDFKHAAGDVKDSVGDILKDTVDVIGDKVGSGIRLAADPNVLNSVTRAAMAYATTGGSEAARAVFTPAGQNAVEAAGANYKASVSGFDLKNPWVLGVGAAGLVAVLIFAMRGRPA